MLLFALGAGAVGWLAGESVRRGRRLGQRGSPTPPVPPPLAECLKLIAEADETQKAFFEQADKRRKAIERIEEIDRYLMAKPGITTGPEFEEFKRMAQEKRNLVEEAETLKNIMDALERGWRDLWRQYHEKCGPRSAPTGMLVPGIQTRFAYGPADVATQGPHAAETMVVRSLRASFVPTGMPKPGTVGPAVSVATEAVRMPTPTPPSRRTLSVPFAPTAVPMAYTGLGQAWHGLGQDIARQRSLLRDYCRQAEWYASLAATDTDFAGTAAHYRDLCAEAQAALTRGLRRQARQLTPGSMEVVPFQAPPKPSGYMQAVPASPMVQTVPGGQGTAFAAPQTSAVSVATERGAIPTRPATPTRPTVSVPFTPAGGGMAFTGV